MTSLPLPSQWRLRCAAAGAAAAILWAIQQPLDRRVFRSGYDDVAYLGKLVTNTAPAWQAVGLSAHAANGAAFGLAWSEIWRRTPTTDPRLSALLTAQIENVGFFPLAGIVDRLHPAIRRGEHPRVFGNRRAFAVATWRHTLFGLVLGELARRSTAPPRSR
jgi:hypothetical protein